MPDALSRLVSSTKFLMAIIGMIAYAIATNLLGYSHEEAALWYAPLVAAIIGQGIADVGKPAAQVTAAAAERLATGTAIPNATPSAMGST